MAKLTDKQRLFVEFYLSNGLNATDAARRAGYRVKNAATYRTIGAENLAKPYLRALIDERLRQATMDADEVMFRLTEHARPPDITEFIKLEWLYAPDLTGKLVPTSQALNVDLDKIREMGIGHLIKSIKQTRSGISIEWHDPQRALELIGKAHGKFRDQVEHSGSIAQTAVRIFIPDNERNDRTG